jgi:hypothetical protein
MTVKDMALCYCLTIAVMMMVVARWARGPWPAVSVRRIHAGGNTQCYNQRSYDQ